MIKSIKVSSFKMQLRIPALPVNPEINRRLLSRSDTYSLCKNNTTIQINTYKSTDFYKTKLKTDEIRKLKMIIYILTLLKQHNNSD